MSDGSSMDEKTSGFDSELFFDEESRQEESRRDKLEFMGIDMGSFCFGFELDKNWSAICALQRFPVCLNIMKAYATGREISSPLSH